MEPGLFGGNELPQLARRDYVENSNDSYWLSNPHQPLTGYPQIVGDYDTARSLRTRIALIMTQQRVDGTDGLGPAGFTLQDMQNLEYSDRQYGAQLVLPQLVSYVPVVPGRARSDIERTADPSGRLVQCTGCLERPREPRLGRRRPVPGLLGEGPGARGKPRGSTPSAPVTR